VTPRAATSAPIAFVYVLGCCHKGRWLSYVGWTSDVARRLRQHNAGTGARTTRGRTWALLHTEGFATREEAMSREWHLKRDRAFRKALIDGLKTQAVIASHRSGLAGPMMNSAKQSRTGQSRTGLLRRLRSSQ
jgi:putative endonuclease